MAILSPKYSRMWSRGWYLNQQPHRAQYWWRTWRRFNTGGVDPSCVGFSFWRKKLSFAVPTCGRSNCPSCSGKAAAKPFSSRSRQIPTWWEIFLFFPKWTKIKCDPEIYRFPPDLKSFFFFPKWTQIKCDLTYLSFLFIAKYWCTKNLPHHPGRRKSIFKKDLLTTFHFSRPLLFRCFCINLVEMEHLLRCGREKKVSGLSPPRNLNKTKDFKKSSEISLPWHFAIIFLHGNCAQ